MGVDEEWTVKRIQIGLEVQIYTIIGYSIDLTESDGTEQKIKRGGLDGRKFQGGAFLCVQRYHRLEIDGKGCGPGLYQPRAGPV